MFFKIDNPMEPELRELLRTTATDPIGDSHNYVSLYGPHARWTVRPHTQTAFWTGYCDLVDRKSNGREGVSPEPFANLCLAERPQEVMPLVAKLIFRFHADTNDNENWEPYEDEFLQWLCHTYQTVLSEYFRITTDTHMELSVVVLESLTPWYEEDRESGQRFMLMEVRIQFPYARIDAGMQNRLVRSRVIQLLRNNNVLAKMQRQPVGDWEQIISSNTTNEPVVLYGSTEVQGRPKLALTHIWPHITREMLDSGAEPEENALEDAFVPQNHVHVQQQAVNPTIFDNVQTLQYWMPMFLSLGYWPTVLLPRQEANDGGRFGLQLRVMKQGEELQDEALAKFILGGNGTDEMIGKVKRIHCIEHIAHVLNNGIPGGTKETFHCIRDGLIQMLADLNNNNVAIFFRNLYEKYIIFTRDGTKELWYRFNTISNLWVRSEKEEISGTMFAAIDLIIDKFHLFQDKEEKEGLYVKMNRTFSNKCGQANFRSGTMNIFKEKSIIRDFIKQLDTISPNIPLNDGMMYNLFTGEHRQRTREDKCTYTINAKYVREPDKSDQDFVMDFFFKFASENQVMMDYLLENLAIYISGDISDKTYMIIFGPGGNNGKSKCFTILRTLLGRSYTTVPEGVLIRMKSTTANAHTAHKMVLIGKRLATLSELDGLQQLDTKEIKRLTGGDDDTVRGLGVDFQSFEMKAHCLLSTNDLPQIVADKATINRTRVFPCHSEFVSGLKVKEAKPEGPGFRYPMDEKMEEKMTKPNMLDALFSILCRYAGKYIHDNRVIVIPDEIKRVSLAFVTDGFILADFINDHCDVSDDKVKTSCADLYQHYCSCFTGKDRIGKNKFHAAIMSRFTRVKNNTNFYVGIKIKSSPSPIDTWTDQKISTLTQPKESSNIEKIHKNQDQYLGINQTTNPTPPRTPLTLNMLPTRGTPPQTPTNVKVSEPIIPTIVNNPPIVPITPQRVPAQAIMLPISTKSPIILTPTKPPIIPMPTKSPIILMPTKLPVIPVPTVSTSTGIPKINWTFPPVVLNKNLPNPTVKLQVPSTPPAILENLRNPPGTILI